MKLATLNAIGLALITTLLMPSIDAFAGSAPTEATYKQVRRCRDIPAQEASKDLAGYISAAGQTIFIYRTYEAKAASQKCGYETDFSERTITSPSKFSSF